MAVVKIMSVEGLAIALGWSDTEVTIRAKASSCNKTNQFLKRHIHVDYEQFHILSLPYQCHLYVN